ncbi:MAG: matrixin family metalloprotease [Planctomycetota bacterium]
MVRRNLIFVAVVPVLLLGFAFSAEAYVLGPTTPGRWAIGSTVTFSFDTAGGYTTDDGPTTRLQDVMPVGWENEIRRAFNTWASVCNLDFVEVADNGQDWNTPGATGDIRIAAHVFDGPGNVLAHGYYPPVNGVSAAGDVHFDIAENWTIGAAGFDIYTVTLHELGHAIGLAHTAVPGSVMLPIYGFNPGGLGADDIAGAQDLYPEVPEPSTWVQLVLSASLLLGAGKRFRRAA